MARTTPRVEDAKLVEPAGTEQPITVGTPAWYAWLTQATTFAFIGTPGRFTARKERGGRADGYWRAFRKRAGKVSIAYLGKSSDLTLERLQHVAAELGPAMMQERRPVRSEASPPAHTTESTAHPIPPFRTPVAQPARSQLAAAPLLATKLYIPSPHSHLVPRPRLLARLTAGMAGPLTLLSAPAGFGKTTVVSTWIAARTEGQGLKTEAVTGSLSPLSSALSPRVAWLSLDAADNDPTRFWNYVIAAIETIRPGVGTLARIALAAPQPPPIQAILTTLINALVTEPPEPLMMLVLDDYHVISTPAIHDALTFLLDQLPPHLRLILTSRADPPLPLSRWRARDQLTEVRGAELRFTPDEAAAFLTDMMGLSLSAAEVAALEARTEGWIAGLHLAALAMRDRSDLAGFVAAFTGSNHFVVDYLVEEVFTRQPAHIQQFLLQTSILDRMCGPLCDAVLGLTTDGRQPTTDTRPQSVIVGQWPVVGGDSYSQLILDQLERANLFLVPLDDQRRWYRYHHLFADVLQARLQGGSSAAEVARLHGRTSVWYEQQGLLDAGLHHALAAHDTERAVQLVERYFSLLMMRGDVQLLGVWLRQLPAQRIAERPRLALAHAWVAALSGRLAEAVRRLREAPALRSPDDLPAEIRAVLALLWSNIALSEHDPHVTETFAQEALTHLQAGQADHDIWRAVAVRNIGIAAVQRKDIATAQQALGEAAQLGLASNNFFLALAALGVLGRVQLQSGQLSAAFHTGERTLAIGAEHRIEPLAAGIASIGIGEAYCERDELGVAIEYLSRGIDLLTQQSVEHYTLACGYVALARAQYRQGEVEAAFATLQRGLAWFAQVAVSSPRAHTLLAAHRIRLQLWRGDRAAAAAWASGRQLSSSWIPVIDPGIDECLTLVRIVIAQRDPDPLEEALRVLDHLAREAEAASLLGVLIEILVLRALALQVQGNLAAALTALTAALMFAAPEGYVRIFVDEGAPMATLLTELARGTLHVAAFAARLLKAFPATESPGASTEPPEPLDPVLSPQSSALVEPLSARELEILRLIANGHSNQAIADTLIVAVSTIKKHINNIYGKLGVQSRTQAILHARKLKLL